MDQNKMALENQALDENQLGQVSGGKILVIKRSMEKNLQEELEADDKSRVDSTK